MPKQTFITRDFFVNASIDLVKKKLLDLPQHIAYIKFVKENNLTLSIQFLYQYPDSEKDKLIDVSILALNETQSLVTLHGSFADGSVFNKDPYVANAVENFERAINASINNLMKGFELRTVKRRPLSRIFNYLSLGGLFTN